MTLWERFCRTGKIEDYLSYRKNAETPEIKEVSSNYVD